MIKPIVLYVNGYYDVPSNMVVIRMQFIIWRADTPTTDFTILNPYLGEFSHSEFHQWLNDY